LAWEHIPVYLQSPLATLSILLIKASLSPLFVDFFLLEYTIKRFSFFVLFIEMMIEELV